MYLVLHIHRPFKCWRRWYTNLCITEDWEFGGLLKQTLLPLTKTDLPARRALNLFQLDFPCSSHGCVCLVQAKCQLSIELLWRVVLDPGVNQTRSRHYRMFWEHSLYEHLEYVRGRVKISSISQPILRQKLSSKNSELLYMNQPNDIPTKSMLISILTNIKNIYIKRLW